MFLYGDIDNKAVALANITLLENEKEGRLISFPLGKGNT